MKIFDKDGDGDFDLKDILIMSTLFGTVLNLVLNLFSLLNLGVSFTVQNDSVLNCGVVMIDGKKEVKCFRPEDQVQVTPTNK